MVVGNVVGTVVGNVVGRVVVSNGVVVSGFIVEDVSEKAKITCLQLKHMAASTFRIQIYTRI